MNNAKPSTKVLFAIGRYIRTLPAGVPTQIVGTDSVVTRTTFGATSNFDVNGVKARGSFGAARLVLNGNHCIIG
jgi:hypothetical protein